MFSARRKPKRIARDEPDRSSNDNEEEQENGPVVRRPGIAPKSKSKLRTSFTPDEAEDNNSDAPSLPLKPKPRIGQHASSTPSLPRFQLSTDSSSDSSTRPSYSKIALEELRNSTPSTPKDLTYYDQSSAEQGLRELDLASKFGAAPPVSISAIPSAAEIAEKKSRRARLAQEQTSSADFIALDDNTLYDSDGEFKPSRLQVGAYLRADAAEKDTRLVRDDEDVLEGFDEFTEDAESKRITMGRAAVGEARRRDREVMRGLIEEEEASEESDEEVERRFAYETAQTAHGMEGMGGVKEAQRKMGVNRPRQPREVTPVPKLGAALGKLRERIARVEIERAKVERRREEVKRDRAEIVASQEHIQRSLIEAGEELERLTKQQTEAGIATNGESATAYSGRGLDSMGLTPEPT